MSPFELLIGVKMKTDEDLTMKEAIKHEMICYYEDIRKQLRENTRKHIQKVQQENKKRYNLRHKNSNKYLLNELMAIKRTQMGPDLKLKLCSRYLGSYRIIRVKPNDDVRHHQGRQLKDQLELSALNS